MGFEVTGGLAAAFLALSVFCGWRGAREPQVLGRPRLIPWRALMLASFVALLTMLAHLATLFKAR